MIRFVLIMFGGALLTALAQTPCENLKSLALPNVTITAAESVAAGPYRAAGPPQPASFMLPAHCRVAAVLTPSADSHIEMELWLPATDWNGKFQAVGNGGWAGVISYGAMASALQEHYATASNDTGHKGGDAAFTIGHPEQVVDFAYRAVHEMTLKSKALLKAFYGRDARLSYWNGCSTGGRQGLMEAQRYPDDFDAVLAGAPANHHLHLHAGQMSVEIAILNNKESRLTPAKKSLLNNAVLDACDALDGVKDGLLTDPRRCHFDPATLACKGADSDNCLTAAQVEAVKRIYAPTKTKAGKLVFPGLEPGGELGWRDIGGGTEPAAIALGSFRDLAHQDPHWDWRTFDLERDMALVDSKAGFIDAIDPNLRSFQSHGGKLLMYHGWSDPGIAPENTVNYYSSVIENMGPRQDSWVRLFMVPGMGHCGGGPGPNQFNAFSALERWRETGSAPEQITAYHVTNNRVDMTRPLCPYPQVAVWKGAGSTNDAASFVCKVQ